MIMNYHRRRHFRELKMIKKLMRKSKLLKIRTNIVKNYQREREREREREERERERKSIRGCNINENE